MVSDQFKQASAGKILQEAIAPTFDHHEFVFMMKARTLHNGARAVAHIQDANQH